MEVGLGIPHTGPLASPTYVRDFCQAADELGFGSLWAVDHVVMPQRIESEYTLARKPTKVADGSVSDLLSPNYECISTLLWVAGFTRRAKLGTAVCVLPIRNPILNARTLATLDIYSGGRLLYGVGVGWLREEAEAMQMPWDARGARSDEHIAVLRRLWLAEGDLIDFEGRFYRFDAMDPEPRPTQQPPPILVGGHSDAALARAGRLGDGWIASSMSVDRLEEHWLRVRAAATASDRDPDSLLLVNGIRIELTDRVQDPLAGSVEDLVSLVEQQRACGVDHLRLAFGGSDPGVHLAAEKLLAAEVLPICDA